MKDEPKNPQPNSKVKEMFEMREPGVRKMDATSVFRAVNFELYAKPNKFVMFTGLVAFSVCVGYMFYMKHMQVKNNTYSAVNTDGTLSERKRVSRWE